MTEPRTPRGSGLDPHTGLPNRDAFLRSVRQYRQRAAEEGTNGCLLIMQLPEMGDLRKRFGNEAAESALRDLLALVEARLRRRDTLGRLGPNTLCILLTQCRAADAEHVSASFGQALEGFSATFDGETVCPAVHRRVITLDSLEALASRDNHQSARSNLFSTGQKPLSNGAVDFRAPQPGQSANEVADGQTRRATVHSIGAARRKSLPGEVERAHGSGPRERQLPSGAAHWRVEPAIELARPEQPFAYRLRSMQPPGRQRDREGLRQALDTLAEARRLSSSQPTMLIVDLALRTLDDTTAEWFMTRCAELQVAPGNLCLALGHKGWAGRLRDVVPVLRKLDRAGVKIMLDALHTDRHADIIDRLIRIELRQLPSAEMTALQKDPEHADAVRQQLRGLRANGSRIVCRGVDSDSDLKRLGSLGVDIGFGRQAGKSQPLASLNAMSPSRGPND